ncbi:nucleotidyltransferase family protein [Leptolyngbya sp. KIOST-1]|uniref:nucleotidyltransferase family protein n=1 Tax=Leptolyngbya sp. KIOST-1 TaxID=1229172 RepID=UPI0009077C4F|nr:nucleotidyltransferase family protein [Leptolyngbya sp. KIOST-1]
MGNLMQSLRSNRDRVIAIATKYGASNIRVFGSVARGSDSASSDVDLLVDMEQGHSLIDRIALIQDLEDLLGHPVDVATPRTLHERIRDQVMAEAVPL